MKKLSLSIVIFCFCLLVSAQNNAPTLKARSAVAYYGERVCIDIETEDLDGDSVFIGSNTQIPQSVFTTSRRKQATGSLCVTITRGVHSHSLPYTMVFYATDKKDTIYSSFNLTVRNYPYKVRPIVKWQTNTTFEVDLMGDDTEPWSSYGNLKLFSKVYDLNRKLIFEDTNRVFTFTAPSYKKYVLISTYKAWSTAYSTRDTLYPNLNVSVVSPQQNSFTIYPNPTTGNIFIKNLPQKVKSITLFDVLGKEIKQLNIVSNSFSIESLPNGMYWVEVKTSQGVLGRQKIIKTD